MATALRTTDRTFDAVTALVWLLAAVFAAKVMSMYAAIGSFGADARAYWLSGHTSDLYGRAPGAFGAFLYSPAFAQVVRPLTVLPVAVFCAVWIAAEASVFAWLLRPLGWRWGVPAFLACAPELGWGNVYALYALVLAVGFRRPAAWAFPLLTKVSPAVGLVWFATRREWRSLAIVLSVAAAIALASFLIAPSEWSAWIAFLRANSTPQAAARVLAGMVVAAVAARRDTAWLLVVAMVLACPLINALVVLSVFAAVPRMIQIGMPQPRQPVSVQYTST